MIKKALRIGIKGIDAAVCTGCRLCVESCMMDVIYFNDEKDKPYVKYPDDCQACFLCVTDCPVEAVIMGTVE